MLVRLADLLGFSHQAIARLSHHSLLTLIEWVLCSSSTTGFPHFKGVSKGVCVCSGRWLGEDVILALIELIIEFA
jgi:hypothetical protein